MYAVVSIINHTHTHTQPFYSSLDFVRDNPGELVPEGTFHHLLDFLVQNEDNTGNNHYNQHPPSTDTDTVQILNLQLERSRVRWLFCCQNHWQVVHTHVPLSPSSIVWYQSERQQCPAAGKVTVGLASHRPCVTLTDISGLSTYGLKKKDEHLVYTLHWVQHSLPLPYHPPGSLCCNHVVITHIMHIRSQYAITLEHIPWKCSRWFNEVSHGEAICPQRHWQ